MGINMKNLGRISTLLITCLFVCMNAQAAVFEDFSGSQFDLTKWGVGERAVKIEDGKLLMQLQTRLEDGQWQPLFLTTLRGSAHNISVKVTVDGQLDNPDYYKDNISGGLKSIFYTTTDDREVYAEIIVNCFSSPTTDSSCNIFYSINYADDWTQIDGGGFPRQFARGTEVTIGIIYNESNNKFVFNLDNETAELSCPERKYSAIDGTVSLVSLIQADGPQDDTSIAKGKFIVSYDDFVASGGDLVTPINDTFSTPWIDPLYWGWANYVGFWEARIFKEGQLDLSLQPNGLSRTQTVVPILEEHYTDYLQADITVDSSSLVTGDTNNDKIQIRLEGWYWNDTFMNPEDGNETGEMGAYVRIEKKQSTGNLRAVGHVFRCTDASCSESEDPFWEVLDCDVEYGIPVTLAIERKERSFTFTCNNASMTYDYPASLNMYAAPWSVRRVRARAYTSSDSNKSYLKAYIDNIYTEKKRSSLALSLVPILAGQHQ